MNEKKVIKEEDLTSITGGSRPIASYTYVQMTGTCPVCKKTIPYSQIKRDFINDVHHMYCHWCDRWYPSENWTIYEPEE